MIQVKTHTKQNHITQNYVVRGYSYVCAYLIRELPQNHITIQVKYTRMQQNHLTQMYVGACVLLHVCVPTMAPVALATGATNGKLPPNTLVRRELLQNYITV